jgi:hypothetical protein
MEQMLFLKDKNEMRRKLRIHNTLNHNKHQSAHAWVANWCLWLMRNQLVHEPDHRENIKQISNTLTSLIEYYQFGHLYSMLLANKNKEISHKKNCTFYFFVIKNGTIVRKTDTRPPRDNS